jgi:hypothetical protein
MRKCQNLKGRYLLFLEYVLNLHMHTENRPNLVKFSKRFIISILVVFDPEIAYNTCPHKLN